MIHGKTLKLPLTEVYSSNQIFVKIQILAVLKTFFVMMALISYSRIR